MSMKFKKNDNIATADPEAVKQSVKGAIQKKAAPEKSKSSGLFSGFASWMPGKNKNNNSDEHDTSDLNTLETNIGVSTQELETERHENHGLTEEEIAILTAHRNSIKESSQFVQNNNYQVYKPAPPKNNSQEQVANHMEQEEYPATLPAENSSSSLLKIDGNFDYEQLAMWLVGNSDFLYNLRQTLLKDVTEKVTQTIAENFHFITKEKYDTTIKNYDKIHAHIKELVIDANNKVTAIEELDKKIADNNNIISEQDATIANKVDNIQKLTSTQQGYIEANKKLSADLRDGEKLKKTLVSANESIKKEIEIGTKILATEAEKIVGEASKKISDNAKKQAATLANLAQQYAEMLAQNDSESSAQLMNKMKMLLANGEMAIKEYQNVITQSTEASTSVNDIQEIENTPPTEVDENTSTKFSEQDQIINESILQKQDTPEEFN